MSSGEWYYRENESAAGPVNLDKLKALNEAGLIHSKTLIRQGSEGAWREFAGIRLDQNSLSSHSGKQAAHTHESLNTNFDVPNGTGGVDRLDGWLSEPVTPWRRYGARIFDMTINGTLGWALIGIAWYAIAPLSADNFFDDLNPALDMIMTGLVATIICGLLIGYSGTSLGKLVFGVRVTTNDGKPIGVLSGVIRDFKVWMKGLAFTIPLIGLITLIVSYNRLKQDGATSWDKAEGYVVKHRPSGPKQSALNVFGIITIVIVQLLIRLGAEM